MKKFISVILLVTIVISCFSITSSAYCSHSGRLEATQTYHYEDSVCHVIRIKYICTNCGSTVHIEEHEQAHSDSNRDGYCDYCRGGSGNSGSSGSSSSSGGSIFGDIAYFIGAVFGTIFGVISFPFTLILSLLGF